MSKDACPECKAGAPEWMATYGDLVTLLMCFFVLLFAFSEIDAQKFDAVMQSFQGSAGVLQSGESISPSQLIFDGMPEDKKSVDAESDTVNQEVEELLKALSEIVGEDGQPLDISITTEERGLKITFPDNALFDSGKADLKPVAIETLSVLSTVLEDDLFENRLIRIEGHTDNVPISTLRFPSNWELSTIRATTVLRYFTETQSIDPNRFMATGYGEYKPVATNDTIEGRALNRRVDIVVLTKEEEEKEAGN